MMLREYQHRTIDQLYTWFERNPKGNPCIVLPTGSGKSHVIAVLCKNALQEYPETRILMLSHVRELISQNAEKMRQHWQNAPLGIYSAGLRSKELGEPITFAGIQSIRNKAKELGHVDLILVDECHLISHKDEGGYRKFINELTAINPHLRVIGLTASPYRLGHGLITDKPALFDDLIEPVSIEELIFKGFLAPLRSKITRAQLDVSGVKKRGGEYIESELQKAVDNEDKNGAVVQEIIRLAEDRKHWLLFCSGVQHAQHIADVLSTNGISSACVTGDTPTKERDRIIDAFKAGEIKALTNANVLTTGFDYPDIDLIAMLRPTMSPSLYVQMAGRGLRPKSHTDHCLVLDFAGNVSEHGAITAVKPPPKKGEKKEGEAPIKACEHCFELVHISVMTCPACGEHFPPREKPALKLHDDDIMGIRGREMIVSDWQWRKHISRTSGNEMLSCTYYSDDLASPTVTTYHPVLNDGYAGQKARSEVAIMARNAGVSLDYSESDLIDIADKLNAGKPPSIVEYKKDGKFFNVIKRSWQNEA